MTIEPPKIYTLSEFAVLWGIYVRAGDGEREIIQCLVDKMRLVNGNSVATVENVRRFIDIGIWIGGDPG